MKAILSAIETQAISAIRMLAADAVEQAKSGHPGMPLGMAPAAYVLWNDFLRHNPTNPHWPDRDRFVLSAGHGSMLLYALLHLTGYDLSLDELKRFRQWGSKTPGHPEYGHTPGVEVTTGPLGQGISTAVGLALAERKLAAEFNRQGHTVVDHYTYVLASDGDLMEGVSGEASSLAGHWGLSKLIVLWDDNHISIDGKTDLSFSEDVLARYAAYGWHTQRVDGEDLAAVCSAIRAAQVDARPSLIAVRTVIGAGSPKAGSHKVHGEPLGAEALEATRKNLNWPHPPFEIPPEVYEHFRAAIAKGQRLEADWRARLERYAEAYPEEAQELQRRLKGELPPLEWEQLIPSFSGKIATRAASGKVLDALASALPELLGGSADLTPSNNTQAQGMESFSRENPTGRYLHYGVREYAMGAILNGLNLHGGYRAYGGTFFVFSDYMRPAIRLAALMGTPTIFVLTHDSVAIGEDGPTHQPIEHLASLRAMPGLLVVRPADALETAYAWRMALERKEGPTALVLTRQAVPVLERSNLAGAEGVLKGGYVLSERPGARAAIVATGSEVALALEAQKLLDEEGIPVRVVSLPCWEAFEAQPREYREAVLPRGLPTLAVEAGSSLGWERYADAVMGLDHFGASAPYPAVYENLGFRPGSVVRAVLELLNR
ncbi:transketolase [Calidithermus timidus]|jgi:transketolase|uniref:transketolase n=1 Tax=Calidithermus timidus TaxID=307124 RepID=UPI00036237D0|nr:transketolase [Calidithermus timidus]